jgi:hypothetical protein
MPAVERAGLAPLRPHDLRHTAVALWIATGTKPLDIARRAGLSSVSFSLDRYGHLFPGADEEVALRLDVLRTSLPKVSEGDVITPGRNSDGHTTDDVSGSSAVVLPFVAPDLVKPAGVKCVLSRRAAGRARTRCFWGSESDVGKRSMRRVRC